MRTEYGGYLPLEGQIGNDFFSKYGEQYILRTNSGKAAIFYALRQLSIKKIYVPYYFCHSVYEMICYTGIEVSQYYLDENLCPKLEKIEKDAGIILVNYYGMMNERILELINHYQNIILDQTHSFFSAPVFREDIFNVYSCRKFIGVPDGGYLIGQNLRINAVELDECQISEHFLYLVKSREQGTNSSYQEKLKSDQFFKENFGKMSEISRCMLSTVDYSFISERRMENYNIMHGLLKEFNGLKLGECTEPLYLYPFLAKRNIKSKLIERKIFVPTIWRELITSEFEGTLEYELSDKTVFLPIDQRYTREDIEYIAKTVIEILTERDR